MTKIEIGGILMSIFIILYFSFFLKKGKIKTIGFKLTGNEARRLCIIGIFVGLTVLLIIVIPNIF